MCEECEDPNALHQSYAEKRKRISAVWKPNRKAGRPVVVSAPSAPAAAPGTHGEPRSSRED